VRTPPEVGEKELESASSRRTDEEYSRSGEWQKRTNVEKDKKHLENRDSPREEGKASPGKDHVRKKAGEKRRDAKKKKGHYRPKSLDKGKQARGELLHYRTDKLTLGAIGKRQKKGRQGGTDHDNEFTAQGPLGGGRTNEKKEKPTIEKPRCLFSGLQGKDA